VKQREKFISFDVISINEGGGFPYYLILEPPSYTFLFLAGIFGHAPWFPTDLIMLLVEIS